MVLTAEALYAQSNSDSNTVKVVVAKQKENLNVFQQWITLKLPRFANKPTQSNSSLLKGQYSELKKLFYIYKN